MGGRATTATVRGGELRLTADVKDAGGGDHSVRGASGRFVRVRERDHELFRARRTKSDSCRLIDRTLAHRLAKSWAGRRLALASLW